MAVTPDRIDIARTKAVFNVLHLATQGRQT
jgi:hypothetical protein